MNASKKSSTQAKKKNPVQPDRADKPSGEGQLSDDALKEVTGGATIPVKRKKKRVIWA
jgi:hypothetical protein